MESSGFSSMDPSRLVLSPIPRGRAVNRPVQIRVGLAQRN